MEPGAGNILSDASQESQESESEASSSWEPSEVSY